MIGATSGQMNFMWSVVDVGKPLGSSECFTSCWELRRVSFVSTVARATKPKHDGVAYAHAYALGNLQPQSMVFWGRPGFTPRSCLVIHVEAFIQYRMFFFAEVLEVFREGSTHVITRATFNGMHPNPHPIQMLVSYRITPHYIRWSCKSSRYVLLVGGLGNTRDWMEPKPPLCNRTGGDAKTKAAYDVRQKAPKTRLETMFHSGLKPHALSNPIRFDYCSCSSCREWKIPST
jgi:hypothetical protein